MMSENGETRPSCVSKVQGDVIDFFVVINIGLRRNKNM